LSEFKKSFKNEDMLIMRLSVLPKKMLDPCKGLLGNFLKAYALAFVHIHRFIYIGEEA